MRWLVASVALIGCGHEHVAFAPPPANLTPEQRVFAYKQLVGEQEHIVTTNQGEGTHSIIMADGREVYYPEDLLPLVQPDSATARHARNAEKARDSAGLWKMGGFVVFLVGAGAWFAHATEENPSTPNVVGPVLMVAGLVGLGFAVYRGFEASHETSAAYHTFDDDLAERLVVCVNGLAVVPCETLQQPAGPPPPATGYYGTTPGKVP